MARSLLVLVLGVSVCQLESALIGSHSPVSSSSSSSNYILFFLPSDSRSPLLRFSLLVLARLRS